MSAASMLARRGGAAALRHVLAGAMCMLACAALTPPAAAQKVPLVDDGPRDPAPAGFKSWDELYAIQAPLNELADQLYVAANGPDARVEPGTPDDGYAGIEIDLEFHEVRLYWRGALPARMQSAVAEARATGTVRVLAATHSLREMVADMAVWIASGKAVTAEPRVDGGGIVLGVAQSAASGPVSRVAGTTLPYAIEYDTVLRASGIATPAAQTSVNGCTTWSRQCDVPPFYGGSMFVKEGASPGPYHAYTTGYPVAKTQGNLRGFMACWTCLSYFTRVRSGANQFMGNGGHWYAGFPDYEAWGAHGVEFIEGIDGNVYPAAPVSIGDRIYTGGPTSNTSRGVAKQTRSYVNSYVRTSGAVSGEHAVKVVSVNVAHIDTSGWTMSPVVKAKSATNACVAGLMDLGGPIFSYSGLADDWRVTIHGHVVSLKYAPYCALGNMADTVYYTEPIIAHPLVHTQLITTSYKGP